MLPTWIKDEFMERGGWLYEEVDRIKLYINSIHLFALLDFDIKALLCNASMVLHSGIFINTTFSYPAIRYSWRDQFELYK